MPNLYFRPQRTSGGDPYFRSQVITTQQGGSSSTGFAFATGSNSGAMGVSPGVAALVRSGGANSGFKTLFGDASGFAFSSGSNSGTMSEEDGDVQLSDSSDGFAFAVGDNEGVKDIFGESDGFAFSSGENAGSIVQTTPVDAQIIAAAVAAYFPALQAAVLADIESRLPPLVRAEVRSAVVEGDLTVAEKEALELAALIGDQEGMVGGIEIGKEYIYTSPIDKSIKRIRWYMDANGQRKVQVLNKTEGLPQ